MAAGRHTSRSLALLLALAVFPAVLAATGCSTATVSDSRPGAIAAILDPAYRPVAEALRPHIAAEMHDKGLPALSIALIDDQRTVWAEGFGFADPDAEVAATHETVYRVGSVSKLFTDIAIMQRVEAGEIDLDAPVTDYLPEFSPGNSSGVPITLRQLMSHRSGLVREPPVGHYFDATEPSLAATVTSLNETTLVYAPESHAKYSNAGIAVVGRVLETVQEEPFAVALRRDVLEPLGMSSSSFTPTPEIESRLAEGIMWTLDGREFAAPTFELGMAPAGSMYSTVTDLGLFMSALFAGGMGVNGRILEPETLEEMWTPQLGDPEQGAAIGIGFILSRLDGHRRVGHNGAIYGFATELAVLPEEKLGVVVVTSKDAANAVTAAVANATLRAALAMREGREVPAAELTPPMFNGLADVISGRSDPAPAIPAAAPRPWRELIGEYGWDFNTLYILERGGRLEMLIEWFFLSPLSPTPEGGPGTGAGTGPDTGAAWGEASADTYQLPDAGLYAGERAVFTRAPGGEIAGVRVGGVLFPRRSVGTAEGVTFQIEPVRPVEELRSEALAATPPVESGDLREPDLVEVVGLDPTINLDIRYASTNNFMGAVFYDEPRAFMQRPAAEALARASAALRERGYGLLIHDAYRPWYVTKMFWDATPEEEKLFVADPEQGSRHNRGCAVDLTLYDLQTGEPVAMVGGYDEFTERSYADYPGGTSRQRWLRELLRSAMESEGFDVYPFEWWHFDYQDWREYPILNLTFDQIEGG
jgi:CubicO group peptidase (beta-lactamase class C family)/D-alanyl-D-alanine dipeptidase